MLIIHLVVHLVVFALPIFLLNCIHPYPSFQYFLPTIISVLASEKVCPCPSPILTQLSHSGSKTPDKWLLISFTTSDFIPIPSPALFFEEEGYQNAIASELEALEAYQTRELVPRLDRAMSGNKWVYYTPRVTRVQIGTCIDYDETPCSCQNDYQLSFNSIICITE